MRKEELDTLLSMISKLKPHEWNQIVHYVQKKYSSKQASVPMPSMEELSDYSANLDFPGLMKSQSECDKDWFCSRFPYKECSDKEIHKEYLETFV